jgi:hypothetical protein
MEDDDFPYRPPARNGDRAGEDDLILRPRHVGSGGHARRGCLRALRLGERRSAETEDRPDGDGARDDTKGRSARHGSILSSVVPRSDGRMSVFRDSVKR